MVFADIIVLLWKCLCLRLLLSIRCTCKLCANVH